MASKKFENIYHFWRLSWVFQIIICFFLIFATWFFFITSATYFRVEEPLLPGTYSSYELPDSEIIRVSHKFLALLEIYNYSMAEENFDLARSYVHSEYLPEFDNHYMEKELQAIKGSKRSQHMFLDLYNTQIIREDDDNIIVSIYGGGTKISNNLRFPIESYFTLKLKVNRSSKTKNLFGLEVLSFEEEKLSEV